MSTVELIGLVELLRQLIQRSSAMDSEYFNDFVQPTWSTFSKIHNDYKSSINEYIKLLAKPEVSIKELINTIRQDSISTEDIRADLEALANNMPRRYLKGGDEIRLLDDYIRSIAYYCCLRVYSEARVYKNQGISNDLRLILSNTHEDPSIDWKRYWLRYHKHKEFLHLKVYNGPRYDLVIYLSRAGNNINRESALWVFENLFKTLQVKYKTVLNKYHSLRSYLLQ